MFLLHWTYLQKYFIQAKFFGEPDDNFREEECKKTVIVCLFLQKCKHDSLRDE